MTYDFDKSVERSIDLGSLPILKRVELSELSSEQVEDARQLNRKIESESPKLVSTHERNRRVEFAPSLLYMIAFCACKIEKVHSVTSYEHAKLFAPYLQMLQNARGKSSCDLLSKLFKQVANSVPGN